MSSNALVAQLIRSCKCLKRLLIEHIQNFKTLFIRIHFLIFEFIFDYIIKSTLIFFLTRRDNSSSRHNEKEERQCISYREAQERKELKILLFEREDDSNWRKSVKVCIEKETRVCYVHTTKTNRLERKRISNRVDEIRKRASKIFWKEEEVRWESRIDHDNFVNYYNVWISKTY